MHDCEHEHEHDESEHVKMVTSGYPSGVKWTKQRKDVYNVLKEANEPLSAVQIYNRVERLESDGTYALSTVYRIMAAFEDNGLVNKTTWIGDGTVVYELNRGGHTHYAVCLGCHRRVALQKCPVMEITMDEQPDDFTIIGHKLELFGYCKECSKSRKA